MLLNRAKVATATAGTGTVTLGAAIAPFQTWAAAGATDGSTISYLIEDGNAWEIGRGVYAAGAGTVTRPGPGADPSFDSSTGALLALSGGASLACVANKADFVTLATVGVGGGAVPEVYGAALAQIAATNAANLPDGGALDIMKDLGGLVIMGLIANTNNGPGAPVAGTSYTVPVGCVAVCFGGQGDDAVFVSGGGFYNHRLWNATHGVVEASWNGGSQSRGDSWAVSKSGLFTSSMGGNPNPTSFPVVGVAGDVLEVQAFTSGDGNYRIQSGVFFLAIINADTGVQLPIYGSGGGRVLLQEVLVTGATAAVQLVNFNNAHFLDYELEISSSVSDAELRLQVSTDGGATFDMSGVYDWSETVWGSGGLNNTIHGANDDAIQLPAGGSALPNGVGLTARIFAPGDTTSYTQVNYSGSCSSGDGNNYAQLGAGRYRSVTAVNAVQLRSHTGNINGGRFRLYGIPL